MHFGGKNQRRKYPAGPSVYTTKVSDSKGTFIGFKDGSTRDENRRAPEIEHLYSPFQTETVAHHLN